MKYMCLIYENESIAAGKTEAEQAAVMERYMAFTGQVRDAGVMVAGDPLLETNTATTIRIREGRTTTTDGPFAETREQLGGYYILDCQDLDEALKYAAMIPAAETGCIEVRPILEIGD